MKRNALAVLVAVAALVGIVDPYACLQYSSAGSLKRTAPAAERARVLSAARRAIALLPMPRGYSLDRTSVTSEADRSGTWDGTRGGWSAPVGARAERAYEPAGGDAADAPPSFEERVFVNAEVALPTGLASEAGATRPFPVPGAAAALVTMAGTERAARAGGDSPGGRVALPLPRGRADVAPAILRVLLADPALERAYREAADSGRLARPARKPPARAGSVETLLVELYGGRRDVEAMARRIPVAALRRLLDR